MRVLIERGVKKSLVRSVQAMRSWRIVGQILRSRWDAGNDSLGPLGGL